MNFFTSASWKTTAAGLGVILTALGTVGTQLKSGQYDFNVLMLALTQIGTGIGLILAKDKNVTGSGDTAVSH